MIDDPAIEPLLRAALKEDIGSKDLTSALIPATAAAKGDAIFKEEGVLCGIEIAERVFRLVDDETRFLPAAKDGEKIEKGRVVFYVEGPCRSLLAAERTAINFLGRMSGVATLTRRFVDAVKGTKASIYDTRKTMPLLRSFDRFAVKTGGGTNHRTGLYDGVLFKDNHLRALHGTEFRSLYEAAKQRSPKKVPIGIEVKTVEEARQALECPFDYVLLDNFDVENARRVVEIRKRLISNQEIEVSGNMRLENVRQYAECGVDRISVGSLTHSAQATDISLNLI